MALKRRKKAPKLKRRVKKEELVPPTKMEKLEQFFKVIENSTTAWYGIVENSDCLKCGAVAKGMIRVGSMKFCFDCFQEEFNANAVERDKVVYHKWLEYENKRWQEELL